MFVCNWNFYTTYKTGNAVFYLHSWIKWKMFGLCVDVDANVPMYILTSLYLPTYIYR